MTSERMRKIVTDCLDGKDHVYGFTVYRLFHDYVQGVDFLGWHDVESPFYRLTADGRMVPDGWTYVDVIIQDYVS